MLTGQQISACMVIPLSLMSLVENIKVQMASVATLFFVMVSWVYLFASHGMEQNIPAVGHNQGSLVGFVLNNFAFVSSWYRNMGLEPNHDLADHDYPFFYQ